ncbi:MAG TPA: lipid-A-disaccharide synthase [Thermoanaerobaculia bacterium]|jgi:lipid-A-disaccharide synthase|nr:lipid-A-disaccharide synthase [Thermoanaerobaculia bacterium]
MTLQLLAVAGEASGDLHAARLLAELARIEPDVSVFGLGGDEMRKAGVATIADSSEISVVGLVEVLKILPRARAIFAALLAEVDRRKPTAALLVDFPDFNLRLAKELARRGVPVVYYVSPQIWAWRKGRVHAIARDVRRMLVLFPFEVEFYRRHGVDAVHVGHPLVDEVPQLPQVWDRPEPHPPHPSAEPFRIALLPGSRRSEVEVLLPLQLRALATLAARVPVVGRIIQAPTISRASIERHLGRAAAGLGSQALPPVEIVDAERFAAIADSHLALCASGTATLEVGLLGTPMIVCYRLSAWTYRLARLLVKLPHVSLVNLVLERGAVPEKLQHEADPEHLAAEAERLLGDPQAIATMRGQLAELRGRLGVGGASGRAAREVALVLEQKAAA